MNSYAQFCTDLALARFFPDDYVGRYIDVGCNHPTQQSNTYLFYQRGWAGVCIDPADKSALYDELRPDDYYLGLAVGQHDGPVNFYLCEEDSVSTVVKSEAKKRKVSKVQRKFPMLTLASILCELGIEKEDWGILSIDVEGYEKQVLEGCPWEYGFRPRLIVLESCLPCTRIPCHEDWEHILTSFGYVHAATCGVNRIYEHVRLKKYEDTNEPTS